MTHHLGAKHAKVGSPDSSVPALLVDCAGQDDDQENVTFALIVPTRGRRDKLCRLFESLVQQEYPYFRVYLGDQNPEGELLDVIEAYRHRISICHILMPPVGISRARNILLQHVSEDVIVLTDDDCYYLADTFARSAKAFRETPDADIFIGRWFEKRPIQPVNSVDRCVVSTRYALFSDASSILLFFRKAVFTKLRFDESMGVGCVSHVQSGEETDLLLRACSDGFTIFKDESILVRHDNSIPTASEMLCKVQNYGVGRMHLLKKHRFPVWFVFANLVYPLMRMLLEKPICYRYRWHMFIGRCRGLFLND